MNRWILGIAILGIALSSQNGRGAVISHDWKTPGDGLLTYDDVNQREWLDLPVTLLSQFPGGDSQFPWVIRENKYHYVVEQTALGGLFEGFAVAKSADVILLAQSAGIHTNTQNLAANQIPATALSQLVGITYAVSSNRFYSIGFLDETIGDPLFGRQGATITVDDFDQGEAGVMVGQHDALKSTLAGAWLYRGVVPEPNTSILSVCSALVLFRPEASRKMRVMSL